MNKEQILGFARHILTAAGGGLVTNGVATHDEFSQIIGGLIALIGVLWSYWAKRKRGPVVVPTGTAMVLLLGLLTYGMIGALTGCESLKQDVAKPAVQAAVKQVAMVALNAGLSALADRVKEARPFVAAIQARLTIPFAGEAPALQAAADLRELVAQSGAPPDIAVQIVATMRESLAAAGGAPAAPSAVPAAPAQAGAASEYCTAIAAAL